MREFKFRAWDTKKKKMINLAKANISMHPEDGSLFTDSIGRFDVTKNFELMQYTGLKDKNNKEVYEGDIVLFYGDYTTALKCGWHTGIVTWNQDLLRYDLVAKDKVWSIGDETDEFKYKSEVLGNIYENPELIKQLR